MSTGSERNTAPPSPSLSSALAASAAFYLGRFLSSVGDSLMTAGNTLMRWAIKRAGGSA